MPEWKKSLIGISVVAAFWSLIGMTVWWPEMIAYLFGALLAVVISAAIYCWVVIELCDPNYKDHGCPL